MFKALIASAQPDMEHHQAAERDRNEELRLVNLNVAPVRLVFIAMFLVYGITALTALVPLQLLSAFCHENAIITLISNTIIPLVELALLVMLRLLHNDLCPTRQAFSAASSWPLPPRVHRFRPAGAPPPPQPCKCSGGAGRAVGLLAGRAAGIPASLSPEGRRLHQRASGEGAWSVPPAVARPLATLSLAQASQPASAPRGRGPQSVHHGVSVQALALLGTPLLGFLGNVIRIAQLALFEASTWAQDPTLFRSPPSEPSNHWRVCGACSRGRALRTVSPASRARLSAEPPAPPGSPARWCPQPPCR